MKTTLIPLDLTHQVLADKKVQQSLLNGPSASIRGSVQLNVRQLFHEILIFFAQTYRDVFGLIRGPPLHDPIAVAVLLDGLIEDRLFDDRGSDRWRVKVLTDGNHSDFEDEQGQVGRTVIKAVDEISSFRGVRIPRSLDVERFWAILEDCMQRAEATLSHPPPDQPVSP